MSSYQVALACARRGWPVVPSCRAVGGFCGCNHHRHRGKAIGKAALVRPDLATTDSNLIEAWWATSPAGVSIHLGMAGLLAIDADSLAAEAEAGELGLPPTLSRVSRGPAWIYRRPAGCPQARLVHWGKAGKLDLLSTGLLVVESNHRLGMHVQLGNPGVEPAEAPAWAVAALVSHGEAVATPPVVIPGQPELIDLQRLELPQELRALVQSGHSEGAASRSETLYRVEHWLMALGATDAEVVGVLWDERNGISAKPRERGLKWLLREVGRVRAKHLAAPEVLELIRGISGWADRQPWHGTSGSMDWHLLLAHLDIIQRTGKRRYGASLRELAERVLASRSAIQASLVRLQARGVLVQASPARDIALPALWELRWLPMVSCSQQVIPPSDGPNSSCTNYLANVPKDLTTPCVLNVPRSVLFHEVWSCHGLGKVRLRLWLELQGEALDHGQVARFCGVSPRQASRLLGSLKRYGLAVKQGRLWQGTSTGLVNLDRIAFARGAAGLRARLRARHKAERAAYARWLQERSLSSEVGATCQVDVRQTA